MLTLSIAKNKRTIRRCQSRFVETVGKYCNRLFNGSSSLGIFGASLKLSGKNEALSEVVDDNGVRRCVMAITPREKEVAAVGIPLATGCMPCTDVHVRKAREAGAS